jgi:acyl-coenzyme A thioesterase 13
MTDTITSLALSTMGIPPPTGASVNISTEFARPGGKVGDEIISVGEVVRLGKPNDIGSWAEIRSNDGVYKSQLLYT